MVCELIRAAVLRRFTAAQLAAQISAAAAAAAAAAGTRACPPPLLHARNLRTKSNTSAMSEAEPRVASFKTVTSNTNSQAAVKGHAPELLAILLSGLQTCSRRLSALLQAFVARRKQVRDMREDPTAGSDFAALAAWAVSEAPHFTCCSHSP